MWWAHRPRLARTMGGLILKSPSQVSAQATKLVTITQTLEGKTETNTLTLQNDGDYLLLEDIALIAAGQDHSLRTHSFGSR